MKNKKYEIFISYRRDGGDDAARLYRDRLTSEGYSCFYDYEEMRSGDFNEQLYLAIDECTDFLLILPIGGLDRCVNDNDWVRLEIAYALKKEKNIIPVMLRDFKWPDYLPEDIDDIRIMQGVEASNRYFDATIYEIIKLLETKKQQPQPSLYQKIADKKNENRKETITQINTIAVSDEDYTPNGNKKHILRKTISCCLLVAIIFALFCFIIMGKIKVGVGILHFPWVFVLVSLFLLAIPGILGFFGVPLFRWLSYRSKSYGFYYGISALITGACIAYFLFESNIIEIHMSILENNLAISEEYIACGGFLGIILVCWLALSTAISVYLSYCEYARDRKLSQIAEFAQQIEEAAQEILKDDLRYKAANEISAEYGLHIIHAFSVPKYDRYKVIGIYNTSDDERYITGLLFTDNSLYLKPYVKSKSKRIDYSKIKRIEQNGKYVVLYGKVRKIDVIDINDICPDMINMLNKCKMIML